MSVQERIQVFSASRRPLAIAPGRAVWRLRQSASPGKARRREPPRTVPAKNQAFSPIARRRQARNDRVAFEADLPAIEFATSPACDTTTGNDCVNPPPGANFYPIYSTRGKNACAWQEGGVNIPGTMNTFGGTSTSEYGSLPRHAFPRGPVEKSHPISQGSTSRWRSRAS